MNRKLLTVIALLACFALPAVALGNSPPKDQYEEQEPTVEGEKPPQTGGGKQTDSDAPIAEAADTSSDDSSTASGSKGSGKGGGGGDGGKGSGSTDKAERGAGSHADTVADDSANSSSGVAELTGENGELALAASSGNGPGLTVLLILFGIVGSAGVALWYRRRSTDGSASGQ